MPWQQIRQFLRREGWLIAVLGVAVLLCLTLSAVEGGTAPTQQESRLAQVLSAMEGAGRVEVALYYQGAADEAIPCGAVIVADGAGDVGVQLRLTRAVTTLLGMDASRVEVFQREGGSSHGQLAP